MGKRHISTYIVFAFVAALSASCQSIGVVTTESGEKRYYALVTGMPVILTSVPSASEEIVAYITPSCPTCADLFNDLVKRGKLNEEEFDKYSVSFVFVPRVDGDHAIIKNLFCADHNRLFSVVSDYFGSVRSRSMGALNRLSGRIARASGVSEAELAACQADEGSDAAIAAAWKHGWDRNSERDWPLVVINGRSTDIKTSSQLISAL